MEDSKVYEDSAEITEKIKKESQERAENMIKEHQIDVEGFYNYYSVPWDDSLYVRFPANKLVIEFRKNRMGFISSFGDDSDSKLDRFMADNYLGSARDSDTYRLSIFIGNRKELQGFYK